MDAIVRHWEQLTLAAIVLSIVFGFASWLVWRIEQPDKFEVVRSRISKTSKTVFDDAGHDGRGFF